MLKRGIHIPWVQTSTLFFEKVNNEVLYERKPVHIAKYDKTIRRQAKTKRGYNFKCRQVDKVKKATKNMAEGKETAVPHTQNIIEY